ncbi:MAG: mercuric reductase [Saprospiraceae bacterium]|nr:MAG: mercuric reductase [Saprospiraceae bacterium]
MKLFKNPFGKEHPSAEHLQTVQLQIKGMTCEHCARSIEDLLSKIDGVHEVAVSYSEGRCTCSYDPSKTNRESIVAAIDATPSYRVVKQPPQAGAHVSNRFDLIIIGGGSAAFAAAIQAEELGLRTLMVNGGLPIGGTCVNVGCVPSKYLIRAAEAAYRGSHSHFFAIRPRGVDVDFPALIKGKKELVNELRRKKYAEVVADFHFLTMVEGHAVFEDEKTIVVNGTDRYSALKFLIATGASPQVPPVEGLEETGYLTNRTLFELEQRPESLTVLGAGYIGLEIAQTYRRLGSRVRIVELFDRLLPAQAPDVGRVLEVQFRSEGIELLLGHKLTRVEKRNGHLLLHLTQPDGHTITAEEPGQLVVATGIRPNTANLGLEKAGVELDGRGFIAVDQFMRTSAQHVFAAGDVANTPAFVFTAAAEGKAAVLNAFTDTVKTMDYSAMPWVVFTDPQVAGAGMDETEAERAGLPFEVSVLPLSEVPRAIAANDTRGFIKLIRNPDTDRLIGARIVAPEGGELIQLVSMAMQYGIPVSELGSNMFPYLTLSEGVKLAAIAFGKEVSKLSCCAS